MFSGNVSAPQEVSKDLQTLNVSAHFRHLFDFLLQRGRPHRGGRRRPVDRPPGPGGGRPGHGSARGLRAIRVECVVTL